MSTPTTHDPLVVNTQDGVVWQRRALTREGRGLYAVADAPACCPEYVMATLAELAEHGLASMLDALPMPVGPAPRTLDLVEEELTGVSLSFYEEELDTDRLRLALKSAQRGRREARARVAELEAKALNPYTPRLCACGHSNIAHSVPAPHSCFAFGQTCPCPTYRQLPHDEAVAQLDRNRRAAAARHESGDR